MAISTIDIAAPVKPFDIPLDDLQSQHPGKRLVVGVAIIALSSQNSKKLLLLQRSDTEDSFPSMYEIPGGGAEPEDQTLLDTVIRETLEETGLVVTRILNTFDGFEYSTSSGDAIQFNFVVGVEGGMHTPVQLNPAEHQTFTWIGHPDELTELKLTGSMLKVVTDGLEIARSC